MSQDVNNGPLHKVILMKLETAENEYRSSIQNGLVHLEVKASILIPALLELLQQGIIPEADKLLVIKKLKFLANSIERYDVCDFGDLFKETINQITPADN